MSWFRKNYVYVGLMAIVALIEVPTCIMMKGQGEFIPRFMGVVFEVDCLPIYDVIQFMLPWMLIQIIVGNYLYMQLTQLECYVLPRYQSVRKWYQSISLRGIRICCICITIWFAITILLMFVCSPSNLYLALTRKLFGSYFLMLSQALVWFSIQLILILGMRKQEIAFIMVLVVPLFSIMLSTRLYEYMSYMPGNWMMFTRSNRVCEYGSPLYLITIGGLVILFINWWLGLIIVRERRRRV